MQRRVSINMAYVRKIVAHARAIKEIDHPDEPNGKEFTKAMRELDAMKRRATKDELAEVGRILSD